MMGDKKVIEVRGVLQRRSVGAEILARTIASRKRTSRKLVSSEVAAHMIVDLSRLTRPVDTSS
jgi:hypothetical protein